MSVMTIVLVSVALCVAVFGAATTRRWPARCRPRSWPAAASGACKASISTCAAYARCSRATLAARRRRRTMRWSAAAAPGTPSRSRSSSIQKSCRMARSYRSTSRWRTTPPSSIARGPIRARSIGRTSSIQTNRSRTSPRPTSPSWPGPKRSVARSSRVDPLKGFYRAEDYHQDFLINNPHYPYIVFNDLPKIENLRKVFPGRYQEQPVLAKGSR